MQPSPQQQEAVDDIVHWYFDGDTQVYALFGYAGTGKTTLAKYIAEHLGKVRYRFAAFTGKAAHVLSRKGCRGASTIHSLIYLPFEAKKGQIEFELNPESLLLETDLLILDEVSMVGEEVAQDLESFGCKILVLGDPAQLPPVSDAGYYTEREPNKMLTEIHRQAEGNPIIEMATRVRGKKPLQIGKYGESEVAYNIDPEVCLTADQLIVGKNTTRFKYNQAFRRHLGHGDSKGLGMPEPGEKIICLRNNREKGLLNGSMWTVDTVKDFESFLVLSISNEDGRSLENIETHKGHFVNEPPEWQQERNFNSFDFGYAITCHKSQGSQWDHVVVIDESRVFREDRWRWLYTAITRAAEKVTIFQKA